MFGDKEESVGRTEATEEVFTCLQSQLFPQTTAVSYFFFRMTILMTACNSTVEKVNNGAIKKENIELNMSADFTYLIARVSPCYQHYIETKL